MSENKLKLLQPTPKHPTPRGISSLRHLPKMPGITEETRRFLGWKSLKWMFSKDHDKKILKEFLKHPIRYTFQLVKGFFAKKQYLRDDDFFLYGIKNTHEFEKILEKDNTLLVVGFSYCHKPFECPSLRFTKECIHDPNHPVCQGCFIGETINTLPNNTVPLVIPTIHYISGELLELKEKNQDKEILFLITACELTLEMFGIWGKMANLKGIGVRLDGRICNTMKAFELSERGIKPGLTVVLNHTQKRIRDLIKRNDASCGTACGQQNEHRASHERHMNTLQNNTPEAHPSNPDNLKKEHCNPY